MSWGIVERVRDKNYVVPSIDNILAGLPDVGKSSKSVWPFVEDNDKALSEWHGSIQPRTDVQVIISNPKFIDILVLLLMILILHFSNIFRGHLTN
jgi:hypothetical protein